MEFPSFRVLAAPYETHEYLRSHRGVDLTGKPQVFGFRLILMWNNRLVSPNASEKTARVKGRSTLAVSDHSFVQLTKPHQHRRRLCAGGLALGGEGAAVAGAP